MQTSVPLDEFIASIPSADALRKQMKEIDAKVEALKVEKKLLFKLLRYAIASDKIADKYKEKPQR